MLQEQLMSSKMFVNVTVAHSMQVPVAAAGLVAPVLYVIHGWRGLQRCLCRGLWGSNKVSTRSSRSILSGLNGLTENMLAKAE